MRKWITFLQSLFLAVTEWWNQTGERIEEHLISKGDTTSAPRQPQVLCAHGRSKQNKPINWIKLRASGEQHGFQRSRRVGAAFWKVLLYYWALCTRPSECQIQTDQIAWHCLSFKAAQQYLWEKIVTRRTFPLVLKCIWPGVRKLPERCGTGFMAFDACLKFLKRFCGDVGLCCWRKS